MGSGKQEALWGEIIVGRSIQDLNGVRGDRERRRGNVL